MSDLNGEIKGIRDDIGGIRSDIGKLQKCYATLAEKMQHPCGEHTGVVTRITRLEAMRNSAQTVSGRDRETTRLWLVGLGAVLASLTAIAIAVLK